MGSGLRRAARIAGGVTVSAGLLAWALSRVDRGDVLAILAGADLRWLALTAVLVPVQVALAATRWRVASRQLGLPLSGREAVSEYALSTLLNQLLPGGIGGDAVRVWRQRHPELGLGPAVRAALLDRGTGQAALVILAAVVVAGWSTLHGGRPPPTGAGPVVVGLLLGFVGVACVPEGVRVLGPLGRDVRRGVLAPTVLPLHAVLSVALLGSFLVGFAAVAQGLGLPVGTALLSAVPLMLLAMAVPVSWGGWGLREAVATVVLPVLGWTEAQALALSAVYGLCFLTGALPGAVVPLLRRPPKGADPDGGAPPRL